MVGLNPLGVAAPAGREAPFIFDASMSSVAGNKIQLAQRLGVSILPGWISEKDGTPIMQEGPIPQEWMVLPLGGTREIGAHKGYSLAMMLEILSSVLGNSGAGPFRRQDPCHHFLAYKISAFGDVDVFKQDMDEYLRGLLDSPTAAGPGPRGLRRPAGTRGGSRAPGQGHSLPPGGHRLVPRHQRRAWAAGPAGLATCG